MRLLDLFCNAGGAAEGYRRAGFTEIVGVDLHPQPRYRHAFIQMDALALDQRFLRTFDAIHASPPCQFGTALRHAPGTKKTHLNLIPGTRKMLQASGLPYIIENVEDVRPHLIDPIMLCGTMFNLGADADRRYELQRHRLFESNIKLSAPGPCDHQHPVIGVYGGHVRCRSAKHGGRGTRDFVGYDKPALARQAMGMDWATMGQMSEAIPPAYTHWLGLQLRTHIEHQRRAA